MTFTKCPSCGVLFHITTNDDTTFRAGEPPRSLPCPRCATAGNLSRLAWEAPRSNNYDKTRK